MSLQKSSCLYWHRGSLQIYITIIFDFLHFQGDYNQASYYLQMSADAFASQWASTDSSETSKQSSVRRKIFCFSDVADFIDLMLKHPGINKYIGISDLISYASIYLHVSICRKKVILWLGYMSSFEMDESPSSQYV